eukprot:9521515-Karenia_brevis.AAC.1
MYGLHHSVKRPRASPQQHHTTPWLHTVTAAPTQKSDHTGTTQTTPKPHYPPPGTKPPPPMGIKPTNPNC